MYICNWYTYVFVGLASEIGRRRREASERAQREERGKLCNWHTCVFEYLASEIGKRRREAREREERQARLEREERGKGERVESGKRLIVFVYLSYNCIYIHMYNLYFYMYKRLNYS